MNLNESFFFFLFLHSVVLFAGKERDFEFKYKWMYNSVLGL